LFVVFNVIPNLMLC